jgi:hypothetical protein
MSSGITGASLTSLANGTTADGPTVYQNDLNLKNNGVNNDGATITTDGSGNMTLVGLLVSGAAGIGHTTIGDILAWDGSNNTYLKAASGEHVYIQIPPGSTIATFDSAGNLTLSKVTLSTGSISRIAHNLAVACINGKTTVNHGLGAIPDVVLLTINSAGAGSTASVGYNPGTLSSTQVDVWANGTFNVDVTTIKF